jgi:hypothetical protein
MKRARGLLTGTAEGLKPDGFSGKQSDVLLIPGLLLSA